MKAMHRTNRQDRPIASSISLPQISDRPKEKCGVVGVWGAQTPARLCYLGLYAQQHRGQESAGLAIATPDGIQSRVGMGLVVDVLGEPGAAALDAMGPAGAIGHNRYSTAGGSLACNAQPIVQRYQDGEVAVGHNGNLINAEAIRERFVAQGRIFATTSDTEVMIHLLASEEVRASSDPVGAMLRRLQGAFCVVLLFSDRIEAARDPWGWRPLVLGELPCGAPIVASETVALDGVHARFIREIEPGEVVTLSAAGVESRRFAPQAERPAHCVFEHVYFASPASDVFGQNVQLAREAMGSQLAREDAADIGTGWADFVSPMPDSGRSAANGYARASGLAYRESIVPNRYVGRTFIKPTPEERAMAVRLKLNVIREMVRGKRIVIVDDSIVRGTTTRLKMQQLRDAGAKEIHLRISCPPIRHPCYFGVDFARREELIAHGREVEEIRVALGVDSLRFLSLEGLLGVMQRSPEHYCTACYSGEYRLDINHPIAGGEVIGEQLPMFDQV